MKTECTEMAAVQNIEEKAKCVGSVDISLQVQQIGGGWRHRFHIKKHVQV